MPEIERLTARVTEFSSKTDFWNNGVLMFLVMTALAAAGIVICQRLAFVRASQMASAQSDLDMAKEHEAKTERDRVRTELATAETKAKEADARIAEAQRGSAEANALAKKAQESLALAEQHSAEANTKAEGFRLDIAKANEGAARATETAERERLARLQLEASLAPRTLDARQQASITFHLSQLGRHDLDILLYGDTPELVNIAARISSSIQAAGWNVRIWTVWGGGMAVQGILVNTRRDSASDVEQVANSLVTALKAEGLAANRWAQQYGDELPAALNGPPWDTAKIAPIRMLIGPK